MGRAIDLAATTALYACLTVSAVCWGAHRGWPLAATQVLAFLALGAVVLRMCAERRLTWVPAPLALPLAAFAVLICFQLAIGNRRFVDWALAPSGAPADLPVPILLIGSVAPTLTRESLVLFLAYASVYFATVHILRRRVDIERFTYVLTGFGALLALAGIVDYLHGEPLIIQWRDKPVTLGRVAGPFVNPDHFATWLAMILFLGIGALLSRRRQPQDARNESSARREWMSRGALHFFGLVLTGVALLLTFSRGALIATAAGGVMLVIALRARGLARRNTVIIACLIAVTLVYAVWIGLGPLLERLAVMDTDYVERWRLSQASLPMLLDFPLLGVGLGAYRDIFPRYQPLSLTPGRVYYPYAHNDQIQLAVETGIIGVAVFMFGIGAVVRHAHLFLFGAERRGDRWNIAIALGALAGCATAFLHAFSDFSARIPANGVLAAALLGIATVALQTRFQGETVDILAHVRTFAIFPPARRVFAGSIATASIVGLSLLAIRPAVIQANDRQLVSRRDYERALVEHPTRRSLHLGMARVAAASGDTGDALAHLDRAFALAPDDPLQRAWSAGLVASMAAAVPGAVEREKLLRRGIEDAREAARRDPTLLADLAERYLDLGIPPSHLRAMKPADPLGQLQLAAILERRGLDSEARSAYERAVSGAAPSDRALYRRFLAAAMARTGDHAGAAAELQAIRRLDPGSVPVHLMLADELALSGDSAQALFYYRHAVELAETAAARPRASPSREAPTATARDRVLQELSGAAFGPEPEQPDQVLYRAQLALARFHVDHGEFREALPILEALAKRPDSSASLQFTLGVSYNNFGSWDLAEQAFRRAVDLDPGNVVYRQHLAQRFYASEKFFEALELWRAAAATQPNNPEVQIQLARAYERIGEPREAVKRYRRALDVDPSNETALRGMAQLTQPSR